MEILNAWLASTSTRQPHSVGRFHWTLHSICSHVHGLGSCLAGSPHHISSPMPVCTVRNGADTTKLNARIHTSAYWASGMVPSVIISCSSPTPPSTGSLPFLLPHLIVEKTEAQKGGIACCRSRMASLYQFSLDLPSFNAASLISWEPLNSWQPRAVVANLDHPVYESTTGIWTQSVGSGIHILNYYDMRPQKYCNVQ